MEHSGVDFWALMRSISSFGNSGGASTITQQLAKLLFTLQQRKREELARANGKSIDSYIGGFLGNSNELTKKRVKILLQNA